MSPPASAREPSTDRTLDAPVDTDVAPHSLLRGAFVKALSRNHESPTVTIVVPARNEARNLELVLPLLPPVHQVVVVDGHSLDDTREVVRRVLPSAEFVQQTRKGKGNALVCGFEAATGDIVVMFDADGSADASEIDAYVGALLAGADFAKGSRVLALGGSEDITPTRDLGNRALTLVTNLLFRTRYSDLCYGYNAFWRDILDELHLPHSGHTQAQWGDGFEIETLLNCRVALAALQVHEVPSVELSRVFGESNLNTVRDGVRVLRTIITERWGTRVRHGAVPAAEAVPGAATTAIETWQELEAAREAHAERRGPERRTRVVVRLEADRRSGQRRHGERRGATPREHTIIDLATYERRSLVPFTEATEESA